MKITNVELIVFDLDGTLADTGREIQANVNSALARWGLSEYSVDEIKQFIGNGAKTLASRALQGRMAELLRLGATNEPESVLHERFFADLMDLYNHDTAERSVLYEGVYSFLSSARCRLALYTNKPRVPTHRFLQRFGLTPFFQMAVSADDVPHPKPDPAGLNLILNQLQVKRENALMVGDGRPDVQVAKTAGVRSVAMLQGFTPKGELLQLRPDYTAERFTDFMSLIEL